MDPIDEKINDRKEDIEKILDDWRFSHSSSGKRDDEREEERDKKRKEIINWLHNFQPSEINDAFLISSKIQYYDTNWVNAHIKHRFSLLSKPP